MIRELSISEGPVFEKVVIKNVLSRDPGDIAIAEYTLSPRIVVLQRRNVGMINDVRPLYD